MALNCQASGLVCVWCVIVWLWLTMERKEYPRALITLACALDAVCMQSPATNLKKINGVWQTRAGPISRPLCRSSFFATSNANQADHADAH